MSTPSHPHTLIPSHPHTLTAVKDREVIKRLVSAVTVAPFKPRSGVVIHTTDAEAQAAAGGMSAGEITGDYWAVARNYWGLLGFTEVYQ